MSQTVEVDRHCPMCSGTGFFSFDPIQGGSAECTQCGGDGRQTLGGVMLDPGLDDVMDKLGDVMDKLDDVMEKLNE